MVRGVEQCVGVCIVWECSWEGWHVGGAGGEGEAGLCWAPSYHQLQMDVLQLSQARARWCRSSWGMMVQDGTGRRWAGAAGWHVVVGACEEWDH